MISTSNLSERIAKCERILKDNADSQAFAPLADALRIQGSLDQAFRICRQGLRRHPDYGSGHLVMAKINLDRKMYDWAEAELNEAVTCDGETRVSEQLRVDIAIARGDFDQAEKLLSNLKLTSGNRFYVKDLEMRVKRLKTAALRDRANNQAVVSAVTGKQMKEKLPIEKKKHTIYTIDQALEELHSFEGVRMVVCANADGTIVDHRADDNESIEQIAAFSSQISRTIDNENGLKYFGILRQVSVETKDTVILIINCTRYILALFYDRLANLGTMRLKLDEVKDSLLSKN